jgi:hypothetical protein
MCLCWIGDVAAGIGITLTEVSDAFCGRRAG